MTDFNIQYSQTTPTGRSPAAPIVADVGAPGRALADMGQGISQLGNQLYAIKEKLQQMTDSNSAVQAEGIRDLADQEFETYKLTNPQETWVPFREKQIADVQSRIGQLNFSENALAAQSVRMQSYAMTKTAIAFTDATKQLRSDTIDTQNNAVLDSFRSGDEQKQAEAVTRYIANGSNMGMDDNELQNNIYRRTYNSNRYR